MRYFFVGIGGVSMSALAKLLQHQGHIVSGSDVVESTSIKELREFGITVHIGHRVENLHAVDCLVVNNAIAEDNPELCWAQKNGIKILHREELLAQISQHYQKIIAVAGCHGKSSTTAMLGAIFRVAGLEPTIHNGAKDNLRIGANNFFITEACEFRKSFLKLRPSLAVITNVDSDHLDCYQDLAEIKTTFAKFAKKADVVVKNATDANSVDLRGKLRTITFGLDYGDVHAQNLIELPNGCFRFTLVTEGSVFGAYRTMPVITLNVPGRHNVCNALGAIATALVFGIDFVSIQKALFAYRGISRRFEKWGDFQGTPVVLDYAHHPREIATTIQTAQKLYRNYLLVFQPHTYSRTLSLWNDFVKILATVPNLVLYKTFAAREKTMHGGRALDLSRTLKCRYFANTDCLRRYLTRYAYKYEAIILCGAGDVVSGEFLIDN